MGCMVCLEVTHDFSRKFKNVENVEYLAERKLQGAVSKINVPEQAPQISRIAICIDID